MATPPNSNIRPPVTISPHEDARLPIYEAKVERLWEMHLPDHVKALKAAGTFSWEVKATALQCVELLHEYQRRDLGADMGREAAMDLIIPRE